jgi:hypothetical protein
MNTMRSQHVEDADEPMVLIVLASDIKAANRKDPGSCAIACAARRTFNTKEVRVHLSRIYVRDGDVWLRYMTPKSLRTEIVAYDRGGSFEPGEHWLAAPPPSKQTGRMQGTPTSQNKRRRRRVRHQNMPRHYTENVRPAAPHLGPLAE